MSQDLIVPTVHINGTSKTQLVADLEAAQKALDAAFAAMCGAMPNGRDYYPQGNEAHGNAMKQMRARLDKLIEIQTEITQIIEAVHEQKGGRHVA